MSTPEPGSGSEAHGPLSCPACGDLHGLGRLLAHLALCVDAPGLRRPATGLPPRHVFGSAVDAERYET